MKNKIMMFLSSFSAQAEALFVTLEKDNVIAVVGLEQHKVTQSVAIGCFSRGIVSKR